MSRLLLKNGYVVTVDSDRTVHPDGFIVVDGKRISAVGPATAVPLEGSFDEVIDARGCIVLPGLINCHQHHWYTLFKGLAEGIGVEDWVSNFLLPLGRNLSEEGMRISSYVAAMEMLATGTTCSLNHSTTTTTPSMVRAAIEPQAELGIRQIYAKELRCKTSGNPNHPLSLDEALAGYEEEFRRWNGAFDDRVRVAMALESNAHWVAAGMSTEELICRGYDLARKLRIRITTHIASGTFSLEKGYLRHLRATGRTDIRYLMQLGILDPHWILVHGLHATDVDIEHMARAGCSLVYTPTAESFLGSGIGPFDNASRAGVNVALGSDGPMVDSTVDMVEQMKVCTLMQRIRHLDPTRMPAERVIEMATINAAKALGLADEIGSLEPGKRADIAIFDLKKPHIGMVHRPIASFVYSSKGTDASAVLVDGNIVFRDGSFPNFSDRDRIIATAHAVAKKVVDQAGLRDKLEPAWRH